MRSKVDGPTGGGGLRLALVAALALGAGSAALGQTATTGPMADYPVVVGAPYTVAGTLYAPEDVLNYDQVGMVAGDPAGGSAITGSHHTLPLPSYVEVTSLDTGRTILVRLERRGPMDGTQLIALSPGARAQLGLGPNTPVRVRRVNPPEDQRALLRAGQQAPLRMDTPMSLVEVLKRKLPSPPAVVPVPALAKPAATPSVAPTPKPVALAKAPAAAKPVVVAKAPAPVIKASVTPIVSPSPKPTAAAASKPPAKAAPAAPSATANGKFTVQAAAFASSANAAKASRALGGKIVPAGKIHRVITGPFATRAQAEASLAKVKSSGYSDARIQTSG